ncbi:type IV pilus modification protein PilV [Ferrimonas pelagia]|uniref:Type IV pilus modification protein PilV n=1 Tax=Ferrimonas pelagia TaxID=1177826 RepID=A0ABP9EAV9_9GAMM
MKQITGTAQQGGMTLIEVIIAAVILSIGLLGVFQLHIVAKRGSYEAFYYAQAAAMANDVLERMRMNSRLMDQYAGSQYGEGAHTLPEKSCGMAAGVVSRCSDTEMMLWDKYQWDRLLAGHAELSGEERLGAPQDAVGCIFVSGAEVEVIVSWQGLQGTSDGAAQNSLQAQSCGVATPYRRQFTATTMMIDT